MPPLDMQTQCTGAVASGTLGQQHKQQQHQQQNKVPPSPTASSSSSPSMDSLRSLAEAAAASPKSVLMSPEAAGERRRSRALKLKQTRSRNALAAAAAAAARNQVYSSAEESDDDEDAKPDPFAPREDAPTHGVEKQAWKKQQRMIRNRESAALSRKRKRDRIESLEQEVARLNQENDNLRQRLLRYEQSDTLQQAQQQCGGSSRGGDGRPRVSSSGGGRVGPGSSRSAGSGTRSGGNGRKREASRDPTLKGRAGHGGGSVNCLNSRESAAFADRVQMVR